MHYNLFMINKSHVSIVEKNEFLGLWLNQFNFLFSTKIDCIISWSAAGHRPAVQGVPRDRGRLHGLVHPGVRGEVRLQSQQGDAECGHEGHKHTLMFRSSLFPKS